MIKKIKFGELVIQQEDHSTEKLYEIKNKINSGWIQTYNRYFKVLDVLENPINIKESIITIETWDTISFSPRHAHTYSAMTEAIEALKIEIKKEEHIWN